MPNELKATPGPYTADANCDIWAANGTWVGETVKTWESAPGNFSANAHLLAASWDLYHALAEIARPHKCTPQQFKAYAQDIASKAMAKARGEQ